ncbi:sigma-54 interaction domain-containing protein [Pseudomonas palleroniana]|uniref:sigma-54 interaction domain-containing protein n=1 Tax=Pseudomonas palleroniana TaxID=191390 RepID=UPI001FCFCDD0|nr:sigma 54-interacting transcriptional regulator [Pseudomonas palleroniana]UOP10331.1 sigma 54-interacting transcriptional regulator [Pseudomonas palleroniana]
MPFPEWFGSGDNEAFFLRRVLDHVSDCLVVVDVEGRVVLINDSYCRLLGGRPVDFVGRHITDVVSPKSRLHLIAKGAPVEAGMTLKVKGQQLFARQVPVYDGETIIGAVGLALFSNLDALKEAALSAQQSLSIRSPESGWVTRYSIDDIIGRGPQTDRLRQKIHQASEHMLPTLILGESGSGKELVANAIHELSHRSNRPFVWLNCASIPDSLIDSELFGYEGGAFTGARARGKPGKFELANGGTLFLDEIGDMPINLQASLLRAVQNQEVVRVGGTAPISIDTRIICATNRPLQALVRSGAFRLDLYYRLNVFNIHLPALREREDLEYLIRCLLERLAKRKGLLIRKLPSAVVSSLLRYPWPGNTRQLENVLLQFLIAGEVDLDEELLPLNPSAGEKGESLNLEAFLVQQRDLQIRHALSVAQDNKDDAARLLGISRATLYRELRRIKNAAS